MKSKICKNLIAISLLMLFCFLIFSKANIVFSVGFSSNKLWNSMAMNILHIFSKSFYFENNTLWIVIWSFLLIPHFLIYMYLRKKHSIYLDYVNLVLGILLFLLIIFIYPPLEKQIFMDSWNLQLKEIVFYGY